MARADDIGGGRVELEPIAPGPAVGAGAELSVAVGPAAGDALSVFSAGPAAAAVAPASVVSAAAVSPPLVEVPSELPESLLLPESIGTVAAVAMGEPSL